MANEWHDKYIDLFALLGYMPNGIEVVEAMLATSAVGAVWSSTSPDFGVSVNKYFHAV